MVYPCIPNVGPEDASYEEQQATCERQMADYRRMLDMAKDLNDYFNTGKRIAVGSTLRMQRDVDHRYDRD